MFQAIFFGYMCGDSCAEGQKYPKKAFGKNLFKKISNGAGFRQ
jgi:hypothetical protein